MVVEMHVCLMQELQSYGDAESEHARKLLLIL
jgi:hypothetical protein